MSSRKLVALKFGVIVLLLGSVCAANASAVGSSQAPATACGCDGSVGSGQASATECGCDGSVGTGQTSATECGCNGSVGTGQTSATKCGCNGSVGTGQTSATECGCNGSVGSGQAPATQRRLRRLVRSQEGPPFKGGPFVLPLEFLRNCKYKWLEESRWAMLLFSVHSGERDGHYVHEC